MPIFDWEIDIDTYHAFSSGNTCQFYNLSELEYIAGCIDIETQIYKNNELVDTHNFQLGCGE